jgi:3-methylcrotonyl-CoA carboxylase alpha subunit
VIRKLLIANRGEIACRIARTCRRMGIATVAVFSDADRDSMHVREADEAMRVGPAEAAQSYLDADAIVEAALASGADAIHPGYGFLSENPTLPKLCDRNGLVWIGPSARAIESMGSKIRARRIASDAGVAGVPGYAGEDQSDARFAAEAAAIGYPLLVKASAGGGGRGMRRIDRPDELLPALALARREAEAAFADPSLLLEKLILRPRHIEVQIAGDKHGNLVHLYERECSIQRNYQKLVEEAPAPRLRAETRAMLHEAALRIAAAIGYDSLGTVEFILDAEGGPPLFLEMNTRLQVEHGVTELITGLDLVEWQIRIASGERLPLTREQIECRGAAIEVRLNAEDPAAGYRPCSGAIVGFHADPAPGLRIDTGIGAGSTVTPYYDSMLAKVIAHGADRTSALARLSAALGRIAIFGVTTNQAFLRDIVRHPRFLAADLTTHFIEEVFPGGWRAEPGANPVERLCAIAVWLRTIRSHADTGPQSPWQTLGGFRVTERAGRPAILRVRIEHRGMNLPAEITGDASRFQVTIDGATRAAESQFEPDSVAIWHDRRTYRFLFAIDGARVMVSREGAVSEFAIIPEVETAGRHAAAADGAPRVVATMPGVVNSIAVEVGQKVDKGETVVVLEAMKLMHSLVAPLAGRIKAVLCAVGETVAYGAILVEIEPAGPAA